jgi:hypothetical protein
MISSNSNTNNKEFKLIKTLKINKMDLFIYEEVNSTDGRSWLQIANVKKVITVINMSNYIKNVRYNEPGFKANGYIQKEDEIVHCNLISKDCFIKYVDSMTKKEQKDIGINIINEINEFENLRKSEK